MGFGYARLMRVGTSLPFLGTGFLSFNTEGDRINERLYFMSNAELTLTVA